MGNTTGISAELGMEQKIFQSKTGGSLPYCRKNVHPELPGKSALLIFFHGAGERGSDNSLQLVHGARPLIRFLQENNRKCVVVFPQCPNEKQWVNVPWGDLSHVLPEKPSDAMLLAMELLDSLRTEESIDPARVHAAGLSMGGYGVWDILSRRSASFASALIVCGGGDTAQAPKLKDIPLSVWHGDSDTVVPPVRSRSMVDALRAAGAKNVQYHEIFGCGHNSWDYAFNDSFTWEWLFSRSR
ncbi:MAG: esterase [Lentisphaerae bacterium ADurb.Bin242]|nr:MAG: esterase [Lentisphaerae bacterium ADurb.Bin242]